MLRLLTLSIALLTLGSGPVPAFAVVAAQDPSQSPEDQAGAEAAGALTDDWKDFTPADRRFTVKLPGKPAEQKRTTKTAAGDVELVLYMVPKGPEAVFLVTSSLLPRAENLPEPDAILDGGRNGMLAKVPGSKITSEKKIRFAGLVGRDLVLEIPAGKLPVPSRVHARILYGDGVLYQLQVIQKLAETPPITAEEIAGFHGSFTLPKPE